MGEKATEQNESHTLELAFVEGEVLPGNARCPSVACSVWHVGPSRICYKRDIQRVAHPGELLKRLVITKNCSTLTGPSSSVLTLPPDRGCNRSFEGSNPATKSGQCAIGDGPVPVRVPFQGDSFPNVL